MGIRDELEKAFEETGPDGGETSPGNTQPNVQDTPLEGSAGVDAQNVATGAENGEQDVDGDKPPPVSTVGNEGGETPSTGGSALPNAAGESQPNAAGEAGESQLQPLPTWSADDQAAFKAAPRNVQEWILRRDKEMNADYQRKTTEIADFRKTWDPVQQMFAPYMAQGINPQQTIQQWATVAQQLEQNPLETLKSLAQQYRVDLGGLTQQADPGIDDQNWEDPQTKALREQFEAQQRQLQTLTAHLQQREQSEIQNRQNQLVNEIQAFASQTNEAGQPAHPHFDEVLNDMMAQARSLRAQGLQPNLQDLYDNAVWANPTTRQKMIAAQQAAAATKAQQEAIDKAKKASHAAKSVSGNATGDPAQEMTIRQSLESLL